LAVNLPSGTVTFLFTDIEGSTRRWEQNAPAMREALVRHDAAMRQAIAAHDGHVFKTIGDAFCAVFQRADDAVGACLDAQRALKSIEIPTELGGAIRVRMALHTGETDERDGDYFGPAVNRVARLLSIGHGEQVLVSSTTHAVAQRWLDATVQLRDMGMHRLKDLADSEHVFQLAHPDLRGDFPPLRSIQQSVPNNLPRELSSFVGRDAEIAQLRNVLGETSLLTLTGSGGCGKSRLALRLAHAVLETFPDGVWCTELGPLSDPSLVPAATLSAIGLREQPGRSVASAIVEHLTSKTVLLLFDGCEHLLSACADLVRAILRGCPNVKILVTSREPLRADGETAFRVPSLALPPVNGTPLAIDQLTRCESVALFVERARLAKPNFTLSDTNAPSVARIVRRLDGIPLAIELAAARVKVLTVEQINAKLDDRFRLLTGGSRTALMRYQTLHAAIAWSYGMLTDDEKQLLRNLSVFAGGWTLEAAAAVCFASTGAAGSATAPQPPPDEYEVLDLLTRLVDKSLVAVDEQGVESRYGLLETVRQFAREEAAAAGELEAARQRHLQYFIRLGEQAEPKLTGPEQAEWLDRLDHERENLLAAMEWSKQLPDAGETGMRLAGAIWRFWEMRGYFSIGIAALNELISLNESQLAEPNATFAKALNAAGSLLLNCGDHSEAAALLQRSLKLREQLGDRKGMADSINSLGLLDWRHGDYAAARKCWEQCLQIRRELKDAGGIAASLNNVGLVAMEQGDYAASRAHFEEALAVNRKTGNRAWVAAQLNNVGNVLVFLRDAAAARKYFEEAMSINRELGNRAWLVTNVGGLGEVSYLLGEYQKSASLFEESLKLAREVGDKQDAAEAMRHLARVARQEKRIDDALRWCAQSMTVYRESGSRPQIARCFELLASIWCAAAGDGTGADSPRLEQAARLLGAAARLRELIGFPLPPSEQSDIECTSKTCRAALGEDGFEAERAKGNRAIDATGWAAMADEAMRELA
jgi:predicted ATPase/class 3 adenylate cyclase